MKTKLLSKLIKQKDADFKNETYFKYKQYRKLLSTLLKISKQSCFANYFQTNIRKDIRKLTSLKINSNSVPSVVIENNFTLTKPKDIGNAFKKYFNVIYFNKNLKIT